MNSISRKSTFLLSFQPPPPCATTHVLLFLLGLFERIDKVYESRLSTVPSFNTEQVRLIERIHLDFVRAGAKFDTAAQAKYSTIVQNLAVLTTKFTQVRESIPASTFLRLV